MREVSIEELLKTIGELEMTRRILLARIAELEAAQEPEEK